MKGRKMQTKRYITISVTRFKNEGKESDCEIDKCKEQWEG